MSTKYNTDPFGNYLCQKLLEFADDQQRTALISMAAPQLVKIAINQHGTRALQRMIDFLSTPEQVEIVTAALRNDVVKLIKDLNGNHVIQKCLNRMNSEDAQFIFDNVSKWIITIGTHRHGCCVIQRCLDHSTPAQKRQIVDTVTQNSFSLNEDPFGNYVTQYILDLREPEFVEPMIAKFRGHIVPFSKHKFSSNVIEKCLRVGQDSTKRWIIDEMMKPNELENMARDSYANYVVQTAMDRVDEDVEQVLFSRIRAVLPTIRTTPHGRRILSKLHSHEQRLAEGRPHPYRRKETLTGLGSAVLAVSHPGSNPTSNPSSKPSSRPTSQSVSRTTSRPVSSHGYGMSDRVSLPQNFSGLQVGDFQGYTAADNTSAELSSFENLALSEHARGGLQGVTSDSNFGGVGLAQREQYNGGWMGNQTANNMASQPQGFFSGNQQFVRNTGNDRPRENGNANVQQGHDYNFI